MNTDTKIHVLVSCYLAVRECLENDKQLNIDELAELATAYGTQIETTKEQAMAVLGVSLYDLQAK